MLGAVLQALHAEAEAVDGDSVSGEPADEQARAEQAGTAAHRSDPDPGLLCQVDAGGRELVDAAQVIDRPPALKDRDDRQVRGEHLEFHVVRHREVLVPVDGEAGLGQHRRLAHPVLL
ncbi:hypothetical protein JNW90_01130 [Micromonospora sp. STR1s_5]|nr:hypothetical protein [Micromonospora sp. STR1s_5]